MITDVVAIGRRDGPRIGPGLLDERGRDALMDVGRPRAEVMEPPAYAGVRGPAVALGVRQVSQVGVLQKVNRSQLPLAEVICASGARKGVLEKLVDSQNRLGLVAHGFESTRTLPATAARRPATGNGRFRPRPREHRPAPTAAIVHRRGCACGTAPRLQCGTSIWPMDSRIRASLSSGVRFFRTSFDAICRDRSTVSRRMSCMARAVSC